MFTFRFTLILSFKHAQQKQQPKSMSGEGQKEVLLDLVTVYLAQPTLSYSQNIVSFVKKIAYNIIKGMSTHTL